MTQPQHPADTVKFRITLATGREVTLDALYQRETYAGLLEGYPTQALNDEVIDQDVESAGRRMNVSHPAVLIQPAARVWRPPTEAELESAGHPILPAIVTYAVFESTATARDEGCASAALCVWYQEQWGLPSPEIVERIKRLEWDSLAVDFDY